jgi:hypothetical protein
MAKSQPLEDSPKTLLGSPAKPPISPARSDRPVLKIPQGTSDIIKIKSPIKDIDIGVRQELTKTSDLNKSQAWEKNALLKRIEYKKKELDHLRKELIEKKTTLAEIHMKREEIAMPFFASKLKNQKLQKQQQQTGEQPQNQTQKASTAKSQKDEIENDVLQAFPDLHCLQVRSFHADSPGNEVS